MSIFNKKWLGKSTAYLLASISASSTLVQTLSEVKVFADSKDKISRWKNREFLLVAVLSWIFGEYDDAVEKIKMVLEHAYSIFLGDSSNKGTGEKLESDDNKSSDIGNKLKDSKYKDICFNEEDLKLMEKFLEYTSKPVNLDLSDEDIEKVLDNVYGGEYSFFLLENLDSKKVGIDEKESFKYAVRAFSKSLAKFVDQKQFGDISFTEGMNSSTILVDTHEDYNKKALVEKKISFNRISDGTVFVKFLYKDEYYTLPLRVTLMGLSLGSTYGDNNKFFTECWRFLDPLCLVNLFFVGDPYIYDNLGKGYTVLGTLKKLCDIFSKKSGCKLLADSAKQAVAFYEALGYCYKKIFEGKTVGSGDFDDKNFLFNYRKKMFKMILSGEIPKGCKIDKKVFDELRKYAINYFNYLGGFDFKDQEKSQEDISLNSQGLEVKN